MARLIHEIGWGEAVLPLPDDPQWAEVVTRTLGAPHKCYLYAAPSPWLREGLLDSARMKLRELGPELAWLVVLVTSQENACRYCYGTARGFLQMLGLDAKHIDDVEREVRVAGGNERERAILRFARKLARSSPRPVRADADALLEHGLSTMAVREVAVAVVASAFTNRFSTFLAVPLAETTERRGWLARRLTALTLRWRFRRSRGLPVDFPRQAGPFDTLVDLVEGTEGAYLVDELLRGAMSSDVLERRTVAWIFAVVATALDCRICAQGSRALLETEGISPDRIDGVLQALDGPELNDLERRLLPWVRETVHYRTETMQRRTQELAVDLDPRVLLEVIGVAAWANSCSRLSMLAQ